MLAFSVTAVLSPARAPRSAVLSKRASSRGVFLAPCSATRVSRVHRAPQMRYGGGRGGGVPPGERALSVLPYVLPLLDSLSFGRYVFAAAPGLASVFLGPLYPVYALYRGVPFVAFGVFLALYVLVVRNVNVSRFVRFNTFQALVLDIALIVPQLLAGLRLGAALPAQVVEIANSSVFYAVVLAVGYAVVANVQGRLPDQIPGVSESVYRQMGPM